MAVLNPAISDLKIKTKNEGVGVPDEIERPTEELIIGMVGAVGAGVSLTAEKLREILTTEYGYSVEVVKVSDIIRGNSDKSSVTKPASSGSKRIIDLQRVGTELRDKFGEDYIAAKVIEKIALSRAKHGYDDTKTKVPKALSMRRAIIVDSLKHRNETSLFRRVYGDIYWQFTVFAPEQIRESRLKLGGVARNDISSIFTTDENDSNSHGQQVSKTAHLSDFFVRNDGENDVRLKAVLGRFLEVIFNIRVHTPTPDEAGMFAAVSAASKSACLSRQVGAAIYSSKNELVSVGWNDVPAASGGLYDGEPPENDHRCFKWSNKSCHNDRKKEELYDTVFNKLEDDGLLAQGVDKNVLRGALKATPLKSLIEYSRSIHAEMEAIVSASRTGKQGIVGGTLYTTTFPCHNCARHIVAAGIATVYYVEPYAKSLALELHSDSIQVTDDGGSKVKFLQYEGASPRGIMKLFSHGTERKSAGKAVELNKEKAFPVLPPPIDGFTTHEKRVIERIQGVEKNNDSAESNYEKR